MGQTSFHASQNRLPWESRGDGFIRASPRFPILHTHLHTPTVQRHTHKHTCKHACMHTGASLLLFTLSKPALKDNKHTVNNMWIGTGCREAQWSKQIRIGDLFVSVCAHLGVCALFTFEEELYLSSVEITVRYALKTSYCGDGSAHSTALPQSLWDGTVWDITGRIPWEREISFLFILSGSDKTRATSSPPLPQLKHTHIHKQRACKHESRLLLKSNINFF